MLLENYLKENKISYRKFAKSIRISATYLCDLIKGRNEYISEEIANRIKKEYPEIELIQKK